MENNAPKTCFLLHITDYSKAWLFTWLFRLPITGRNTRGSNPWWADGKEEGKEDCTNIACMLTERTHCE